MGRAPCCDKANVKKGPWSPEEDAKLKSYIEKNGTGGNWIALPHKIGLKRCGKSCRLRWLNYLRPNIKHGGFTEDEDNLICSLYVTIGSRWSIIAAQLPGRTDNDIKNYWNTRLKKKLLGREKQSARLTQPPLYASRKNQLNEPASNSFTNILVKPQLFEPNFPNLYGANYHKQFCKNDQLLESDLNFHYINELAAAVDFPPLDHGINPEEILYNMPDQELDGVVLESFSAVEMVNCGTISPSASPENASWASSDINSVINYSSAVNNYEFCDKKMPQDWMLFDDPRLLLGYSQ